MNKEQLHDELEVEFSVLVGEINSIYRNAPSENIQEKIEALKEKFIKSYDSKIAEILQELVGEAKKKYFYGLADRFLSEGEKGDMEERFDMHREGYNNKRQEIIDKIKTLGYE